MIGFSFQLQQEVDDSTMKYFKDMKDSGFSEVFTSAHFSTNEFNQTLNNLSKLIQLIDDLRLHLIIDVDRSDFDFLKEQSAIKNNNSLITFRLNHSFTNSTVAQLLKSYSIALNASTIGNNDIRELKDLNVDFNKLDVWYDSYPHIDTGLDLTWFAQKNRWLKKLGFQIHAFVPGDKPLNGPLFDGMPTLERHRKIHPFIAAIELQKLYVDNIVIGDNFLSKSQRQAFYDYFVSGYIPLHISDTRIGTPEYLFTNIFHNRKDPARDLIRLAESTAMNHGTIEPTNNTKRIFGSVTIDNRLFGTYMGEIQIVCTHLPASQRVNILGKIIEQDLKLLSYIDGGSAFKLIK